MADRKKVIKGLQNCRPSWFTVEKCSDDSCPYNQFGHEDGGCVDHLIDDALELLKEQESLEKKYTALLNEKISELIEEIAKLNAEMNQALSERSIHTADRS